MTVADDGRGHRRRRVTAGVGLLSLRERAEELGGQLRGASARSGGGTTVRAVLPYGGRDRGDWAEHEGTR